MFFISILGFLPQEIQDQFDAAIVVKLNNPPPMFVSVDCECALTDT